MAETEPNMGGIKPVKKTSMGLKRTISVILMPSLTKGAKSPVLVTVPGLDMHLQLAVLRSRGGGNK